MLKVDSAVRLPRSRHQLEFSVNLFKEALVLALRLVPSRNQSRQVLRLVPSRNQFSQVLRLVRTRLQRTHQVLRLVRTQPQRTQPQRTQPQRTTQLQHVASLRQVLAVQVAVRSLNS